MLEEYKREFREVLDHIQAEAAGALVEREMAQQELMKLMQRAHEGTVRDIEHEALDRRGDVVAELKFPRPTSDQPRLKNLHGWHYRLYAGAPTGRHSDYLVWSLAGRKPDAAKSKAWWSLQDGHIDQAFNRFKQWIISRCGV
ncbi:hypothetical protein [Nocardia rhizosphaerae]|uniref:HK97 gp10 family phage protein n=1 Tax=Nocardia rhizosphaerae TaxID=1691571 RepID=A0ABV8L2L0_9NOCA